MKTQYFFDHLMTARLPFFLSQKENQSKRHHNRDVIQTMQQPVQAAYHHYTREHVRSFL